MRIERIATRQGHPVPETAHQPKGPFPPELFESPQVISDYVPQPDGGTAIPVGGTAQNNFTAVKWFRCRVCDDVLREQEVDDHNCED
jgi:hypothetical protein